VSLSAVLYPRWPPLQKIEISSIAQDCSILSQKVPKFELYVEIGTLVSEEKNFKNQPIRNKSNLWQPWLLTDRDEMCNLVRGPSIDASYQDLVPLGAATGNSCFLLVDI
jgi:hypothetical protein